MSQIDAPEDLRRRFELASKEIHVAGCGYTLLKPKSLDDLISEEDFDIDERIPYWADCWPSARVMAELIAQQNGGGRQLLELGCGIGLVSLAACRAGFEVLATDYYAEALEFTAANAERNGLEPVDTRLVDWRKLPGDLGTYDLVVASDVLYERPQCALVAGVIARTLSPDGLGLITDPGRRPAKSLLEACAAAGLVAHCTRQIPQYDPDTKATPTIYVYEVRRASR